MTSLTAQIAKHVREIHTGGNWTVSNLKDMLEDVNLEQATTVVKGRNTIATLTFHVHYFVDAVTKVLEGGSLDAKDKFSFDHPNFESDEAWRTYVNRVLADGERFAKLIEVLPDERMWEPFVDEKYGIYYRNLNGISEHTHYHLGQISLLKKMIQQD